MFHDISKLAGRNTVGGIAEKHLFSMSIWECFRDLFARIALFQEVWWSSKQGEARGDDYASMDLN